MLKVGFEQVVNWIIIDSSIQIQDTLLFIHICVCLRQYVSSKHLVARGWDYLEKSRDNLIPLHPLLSSHSGIFCYLPVSVFGWRASFTFIVKSILFALSIRMIHNFLINRRGCVCIIVHNMREPALLTTKSPIATTIMALLSYQGTSTVAAPKIIVKRLTVRDFTQYVLRSNFADISHRIVVYLAYNSHDRWKIAHNAIVSLYSMSASCHYLQFQTKVLYNRLDTFTYSRANLNRRRRYVVRLPRFPNSEIKETGKTWSLDDCVTYGNHRQFCRTMYV